MDKTLMPKDESGNVEKDEVKLLFMASPFIKWVPFAESMGWNPARSRSDFPVNTWVDEKMKMLSDTASERLGDILFGHTSRWHSEVMQTLDSYPALVDKIKMIFDRKLEYISNQPPSAVSCRELAQMASTCKTLVEAAYKARLIDKWSFELAQSHLDAFQPDKEDSTTHGFSFLVKKPDGTAGPVSVIEMQAMMARYLDQPLDTEQVRISPINS